MKKSVLFLSVIILSVFAYTIQATNVNSFAPQVNPYVSMYTEDQRIYPFVITQLSSTVWTDLTVNEQKSIAVCDNYDLVIVIAENTNDANNRFAAGEYTMLKKGEGFIIPLQTLASDFRVYAKCISSDIVSDYIDNAPAANKGVFPEQVGIPITGHSFHAGDFITIAGTQSYDGTYRVISTTANEVVIFCPYVSELFAGIESVTAIPTVEQTCGQ